MPTLFISMITTQKYFLHIKKYTKKCTKTRISSLFCLMYNIIINDDIKHSNINEMITKKNSKEKESSSFRLLFQTLCELYTLYIIQCFIKNIFIKTSDDVIFLLLLLKPTWFHFINDAITHNRNLLLILRK